MVYVTRPTNLSVSVFHPRSEKGTHTLSCLAPREDTKYTLPDYLRSVRPLCVLKMPRELPGFYFDAEKNRYFPASSKQAGRSHPPHSLPQAPAARHGPHTSDAASPSSSTPPPQNAQRRQSPDIWHALQLSRLATCPRQRIATHQLRRHSSN
jgi:hypothetical protein